MWNGNSTFGSNAGDSLGASIGNAVGSGDGRWPPPTWLFGLRLSDDRGSV